MSVERVPSGLECYKVSLPSFLEWFLSCSLCLWSCGGARTCLPSPLRCGRPTFGKIVTSCLTHFLRNPAKYNCAGNYGRKSIYLEITAENEWMHYICHAKSIHHVRDNKWYFTIFRVTFDCEVWAVLLSLWFSSLYMQFYYLSIYFWLWSRKTRVEKNF